MKLCILGGGGFRTPYVYQALLRDGGTPRITEVALYDIDEDRLRSMTMILEQFAVGFDDAPEAGADHRTAVGHRGQRLRVRRHPGRRSGGSPL